MNNFDLGKMLTRFTNYQAIVNAQNQNIARVQSAHAEQAFLQNMEPSVARQTIAEKTATNLQMNTLQSMDMSVYAKEVMQLPKNLNELVFILQKGLTQAQFNQMYAQQLAAQRNSLSQTQAQILAQLQGLTTPNQIQNIIQTQMVTQFQSAIKNLPLSANGMINLTQIGEMLQINGKEALTKIITAMTQASKQGITDLTQMKDMARLINASVATAAKNDPAQTLKVLMLLYLPWLPLDEGVGFDLDIETNEEKGESDSVLTITITTVNYGVVVATLILETSNSVHVSIECTSEFPQEELMIRLGKEEKNYSMNSVVTFSEKVTHTDEEVAKAKINMSQTTEINPYMLMMAHMIIRYVIEIDNNTTMGILSHVDGK